MIRICRMRFRRAIDRSTHGDTMTLSVAMGYDYDIALEVLSVGSCAPVLLARFAFFLSVDAKELTR